MALSKRLLTVARAVTPGKRVADIGTDHGYVPIYLVETGLCPLAIAMDVNPGPLERASAHIREKGLEDRISSRLSDGLERLDHDEADAFILSGMGGDLICRILRDRKDLLADGPELVLQPQSEWFKVRHALHELNYRIEREWFLKDEGKYYVVLKAGPGSQKFSTESDYDYGAFVQAECSPVLEEYLLREEEKNKEILLRIRNNVREGRSLRTERISELEESVCRIRQRLAKIKG